MRNFKTILLILLLNSILLSAQNNFFKTATNSQLSNKRALVSTIKKTKVYSLDEKAMRIYLQNAPLEFKNNGLTIPLQIPLPDGSLETFNMVESPTLSSEIAALHPEIKTYNGNGTTNKKAVIRLSLTSNGFNAIILNVGDDAVYFESYSNEKSNIYFNYYSKDVEVPEGEKKKTCELDFDDAENTEKANNSSNRSAASNKTATSVGTQLRTFRLAISATAEFVAQNGGTEASGFSAVVAYVNRFKALFRNELAVDFVLVSGSNMVYTNAATDPFTNGNASLMLGENRNNCNTVLGNSNFDIGHVLGAESGSGSGLAVVGSLCNSTEKARAASLEGNLSQYSQVFMDALILHEMGHQFGMNHSYNSTVSSCSTRRAPTSVEPGSGATIMSYGFICGSDDYSSSQQVGPLLQYHTTSYEEALAFLSTVSCQVTTQTNNLPPVISVPSSYTIPKSTPFVLTGSATDANNDNLTYCWEGTNIGTIVPTVDTLDDTAQPPFFRSYPPSTVPFRIYPILESILNGTNQAKGDKLPSVGVVTTHRFTVRDNNANGGGVTNANVTVTIDGNTGPFLETTNLSGIHSALSTKTITWSVNGTDINTPTINILLSTDGGYTFPTTLASNTPNDGSQVVTLPNIGTRTARIKIESIGNIFFDISNVNFTIEQPLAVNVSGTNVTSPGAANGTVTAAGFGGKNTFNYSVRYNFTSSPYNVDFTPLTTFSTISVPSLPAGATVNSAILNFVNIVPKGGSWARDILAALTGVYSFPETSISSGLGVTVPLASLNLPNFPTTGGFLNLRMRDEYNDSAGIEATIASANIDLNYAKNGYTYLWSNGATTPSISSLVPGVYSVTVTDASGATATGSYTVRTNYSIVASATGNGIISPAGTSTVVTGGSQIYTFTPDSCHRISDVKVNGISIGAVTTYTFSNVTANHQINVTFVPNTTQNVTTIAACDSYIWNGTTYNQSGLYTGTTANCVTEKLDLTITPSSINTTSIVACDSYFWNETTYTQSGLYTGTTTNCVTEKLDLTIVPSPNAGIDGTLNNSTGVAPTDAQLFAALSGADAGGTWSQNGLVYTYTVTAISPCLISDTAMVTVINTETIPTSLTFCQGAKISDAIGTTTMKFYTAITRGTLLLGTANLSTRTVYATQTVNGLESTPRVPVLITVNPLPMTPIPVVLTEGATLIKKVGKFIGTTTALTLTATAAGTVATDHYNWTLPSEVNQLSGNDSNTITIDFADVTPGNTNLEVLVSAVSPAGCVSKTARKLILTRAEPRQPRALTITDSQLPELLKIKKLEAYTDILKNRTLTLTATPNETAGFQASSYKWVLPAAVNTNATAVVGEANTYTSTSNVIEINLSNYSNETTLDFKVFGVNGNGTSLISRDLLCTVAPPNTPGAITTPLLIKPTYNTTCNNVVSVQVPSVLGVTYTWSVDGGAVIIAGQGTNAITIDTALASATLTISVTATNGLGTSLPKILTLKKSTTCKTTDEEEALDLFSVKAYPNPSSSEFTIDATGKGAISVKVYDMQGRLVENTNSTQFGSTLASGTYNVVVKQGSNVKTLKVIKK